MAKILVFLAEGCEETESLATIDVLRRAGYEVCMASVLGTKVVEGSHGIRFETDTNVADLSESEYMDFDAVVLPGGAPGFKNLMASEKVKEITTKFAERGKLVSAICAAPTVLGAFGLLEGKNACCYPGMEDGLTGAKPNTNPVTIDGNIITSRGVGTVLEFALSIVSYFDGEEKAKALGDAFVWKKGCLA